MNVRIDYDPLLGLCFWVNNGNNKRIDRKQVPLRSCIDVAISTLQTNPHLISVLNRLEHHKICVAALGYAELHPLDELNMYRTDGLLDVHHDGEYIGVIRTNGD